MLTLAKEEMAVELERVQNAPSASLSVEALRDMSSVRIRHLLRYWIDHCGAPMPNSKKLIRIEEESIHGRDDAKPLVSWGGWEVRRYRDDLILRRVTAKSPQEAIVWQDRERVELPNGLGTLVAKKAATGLDCQRWQNGQIEVRFRKGGERCIPSGRCHHKSLKKLFQEWGVPPWERDQIPLIYIDGELAAIPGKMICEGFAVTDSEIGIQVLLIQNGN
jgi:tRNA(Ile)-lysidine synthase